MTKNFIHDLTERRRRYCFSCIHKEVCGLHISKLCENYQENSDGGLSEGCITCPNEASGYRCFSCGSYAQSMVSENECPKCAKAKRKAEDKKDREEFYAELEDMSDPEQLSWVLEWIRNHRLILHCAPSRPNLPPALAEAFRVGRVE